MTALVGALARACATVAGVLVVAFAGLGVVAPDVLLQAVGCGAPVLADPPPMRAAVWEDDGSDLWCLQQAPFLNHPIYWPVADCAPGLPVVSLTAAEYQWIADTFAEFAAVQAFLRTKMGE